MSKAFFVKDAPGEERVAAFATRDGAEAFVAKAGGGQVLDYHDLVRQPFPR
ncbi:MAG: hypothetical protein AB1634_14120 [Thermodesulfobacteriota bacterium]